MNLADLVILVDPVNLQDFDSGNSVDFVESGGYVGPGESGYS